MNELLKNEYAELKNFINSDKSLKTAFQIGVVFVGIYFLNKSIKSISENTSSINLLTSLINRAL
jgi:hypothetical protein